MFKITVNGRLYETAQTLELARSLANEIAHEKKGTNVLVWTYDLRDYWSDWYYVPVSHSHILTS